MAYVRKKTKELIRAASRWKFKAWITLLETGLAGTALLVMLGLWWTLEPWQADVETPFKFENKRRDSLNGSNVCSRGLYPSPWELRKDQLTILVNGFAEVRIPLLQSSVRMYSASPVVHSVLILWGNTSTPDSLLRNTTFESLGAPIYIVRQESSSLNDRFLPRPYIKTKAVVICDDDMTLQSDSLTFALKVWQENPKRIVGFFPRAHSYQLDSHSWIYTKNQRKYSIMLTKIMLLATEYLYKYSCEMPAGVRNYVNKGMNCEDIAMNFLVSHISGLGPLLVEGQPRDWGDTRNSEEGLSNMGLSARAEHRKDRGDCIAEFQRLWNGMELRFSHVKAVADVEELVNCEKYGELMQCDKQVGSIRDAQRLVAKHLIRHTYQYAYVTLIESRSMLSSVLVLAQSLRNTGTVHDLVLLVAASVNLSSDHAVVHAHFDLVKEASPLRSGLSNRNLGKLRVWQLVEYERVIFVDVNTLVLCNLDHLFELPEPAAVPKLLAPDEFDTGLLVLKPSNATFLNLLTAIKSNAALDHRTEHQVLNDYFSGWFQMPSEHRLPLFFNMPVALTKSIIPSSMNITAAREVVGPVAALRFPRSILTSAHDLERSEDDTRSENKRQKRFNARGNIFFEVWLELLHALRSNKFRPLAGDKVSRLSWVPDKAKILVWPPKSQPIALEHPSLRSLTKTALVTVVWTSEQLIALAGWATTYSQFHLSPSRHETLLLVHASVESDAWSPFRIYFNKIVVLDPVHADIRSDKSAAILHLWNQTEYQKLLYVHPTSLFMDNCNFLWDFAPFAATPNSLLPDTFSIRVMVIQPDRLIFRKLIRNLALHRSREQSVVMLLNKQFSEWYQSSPKHRIPPISNPLVNLQRGLEVNGKPWKILSFLSIDLLDAASESAVVWNNIDPRVATHWMKLYGMQPRVFTNYFNISDLKTQTYLSLSCIAQSIYSPLQ